MFEWWKYLTICLLCGFYRPALSASPSIEISETSGPGTVLYTENGSENCSIVSTDPFLSDQYFTFDDNNTDSNENIVLIKSLDLEVLTEFTTNPAELTINYSCRSLKHAIHVRIMPENEFDPIFINSPYHSIVTENVKAGTEIFNLGDKCKDEDRILFGFITGFKIHQYQITAFDGRRYIRLDEHTGRLTTTVVIDYDSLPRSFFMLNISVTDDGGRSSLTSVNVSVIDVDDNPPYFTSCADVTPCHVTTYSADIDRFFHGIPPVLPAAIHAMDGDRGINADIKYSIESNHTLADNLYIDEKLGDITVLEPFSNFTNFTEFLQYTIPVTITVVEETPKRQRAQAELVINVYYEFPTTASTVQESTSEPIQPKQFDYVFIVEIAVPVGVAVIVLIIIIVIIVRKKQKVAKETRYLVGEKEREKSRKVDEHNISTIDVLSSTPINPYELTSVYARISTGSGYEIIEVLSRDDGKTDSQSRSRKNVKVNSEVEVEAMNEESGREKVGNEVGSEIHADNMYAVVKKPKSRLNNTFKDFVNNTAEDAYDRVNENTKTCQEAVDGEESDASCTSIGSNGEFDYEIANSEPPPELCVEGDVMY